jgi:predicted ATP-grasp superfamily ATP-dependent carboligase
MILGASARAAAFSALRAGLRPWCADLFADVDLQRRCPATRLPGRYPHDFLGLIDAELPGPWLYTGGLENWPGLVRRLSRRRPLWGNGPDALRLARDPLHVRRLLKDAGLPVPEVYEQAHQLPPHGRWLWKPRRGSGGTGVRFWTPGTPGYSVGHSGYFQEFLVGDSVAALFVGDGRRAWLLGLTRQLVGLPWLHAAPFHYCGSVGPLEPDDTLRAMLQRLGDALAGGCGLRGLFGVDGVLRGGHFLPVEVNPRYTASVEVLENATGLRALAWHRLAFTTGVLPGSSVLPSSTGGYVGKAILFARADLTFPAVGPWSAELRSPVPVTELPDFADLPPEGEVIPVGRPVLTLFVRADTLNSCEDQLRQRASDLDRRLFGR